MTSVTPVPIVDDVDALAAFLASERAPTGAMPISVLDGFLTAILIGPGPIMPSAWLPEVWGGGSPAFADLAETKRVLGAIMGRYNAINRGLDAVPPRCEPILEQDESGRDVASRWAEGFVAGIALDQSEWRAIFDDRTASACMYAIVGICVDETGRSRLGLDATLVARLAREAPGFIPAGVFAIRAFWRMRASKPRRRATGRRAKRKSGKTQ